MLDNNSWEMVITHKSTGLSESALLDDFAPEILRYAQDDTLLHSVILNVVATALRKAQEKDLVRTSG